MAGIPEKIGNFEVIRQIGSGGMGAVYLARDPELDRQVAIKVIREEVSDQEVLDRFFREARAAAALRHVNIVTVYASGQHNRQPYMAMEYIEGESFADIIKQRRTVPLADKVSYLEQLCSGLAVAHKAGIVHRDIKPANIMVDREGVVRILDFGIARIEGSAMTEDGTMMGSLNYMSPEQMLGRPVDLRSDIFSVGSVAYELLSYQQAFKGSLNDGLLHRLPHEDPPSLLDLYPGLPLAIEQAVMRALEKDPGRRFRNLSEMREALLKAQDPRKSAGAAARADDQRTVVIARPPTAPSSMGIPAVTGSGAYVAPITPYSAGPAGGSENRASTPARPAPMPPPPPAVPAPPALKLKSEVGTSPKTPSTRKPATAAKAAPPAPNEALTTAAGTRRRPPAVASSFSKWILISGGALVVAIGLVAGARPWFSAPVDPMEVERPAIEAAMERYRSAYRNRDLEGVTSIFPTLPADTSRSMQQAFRNCLVYEVTFGGIQIELDSTDPARARVNLRSTHTCTPNSGGRQTEVPRHELFELRKTGDAWTIDSAVPVATSVPRP